MVRGSLYDSVKAEPGDIPYHAGVYSVNTLYDFECSGAVLSAEYVLTTATCVRNLVSKSKQVVVAAGSVKRLPDVNVYHEVSEIIIHDKFDSDTKANDIALLKLANKFTMSSDLSSVTTNVERAKEGTLCIVSGWRHDVLSVAHALSYANINLFEDSSCSPSGEGVLCVGTPEEEYKPCLLGDEGSPVVCNGLLTGLLHYNDTTCFGNTAPVKATNIAVHSDWIREQVTTASSTSRPVTLSTSASNGEYDVRRAAPGEVAYQAAVWFAHEDLLGGTTYDFHCAGAVVAQDTVLTTATCADNNIADLFVSVGHVSRRDDSIEYFPAVNVTKHEDFDSATGENDIALIKVSPGFSFSLNVSIVPLAGISKRGGSVCTISGWRNDVFTVGYYLMTGRVSVFEGSVCISDLDDRFCAGIPPEEHFRCLLGDDGGPLVCDGELSGLRVYSAGPCLQADVPGMYVDVPDHRDWILRQLTEDVASTVGSTAHTVPTETEGSTTGVLYGDNGSTVATASLLLCALIVFINLCK